MRRRWIGAALLVCACDSSAAEARPDDDKVAVVDRGPEPSQQPTPSPPAPTQAQPPPPPPPVDVPEPQPEEVVATKRKLAPNRGSAIAKIDSDREKNTKKAHGEGGKITKAHRAALAKAARGCPSNKGQAGRLTGRVEDGRIQLESIKVGKVDVALTSSLGACIVKRLAKIELEGLRSVGFDNLPVKLEPAATNADDDRGHSATTDPSTARPR